MALLYIYIVWVLFSFSYGYLEFQSSTSYSGSRVTISDVSKINTIRDNSFTFSVWFRGNYAASSSTRVLIGRDGAFMVAFHGPWSTRTTLRPYMAFHYRNNMNYDPPQLYTNGNWQHLTITREIIRNGTEIDCYLRYYINATQIYSMGPTKSDFCSYNTYLDGGVLKIGDAITTYGWGADIAEISIWNRSLIQPEIMSIYTNISLNPEYISFQDLLHYYPLNETAQTCTNTQTVQDIWNNHDATLSTILDPLCVKQEIMHPIITDMPSIDPTSMPSTEPSSDPSIDPTMDPTADPTADPTEFPSSAPTSGPTESPLTEQEVVQAQDENVKEDSTGETMDMTSDNNPIENYIVYIIVGLVAVLCLCLGCLYLGYRWGKSQQQTTEKNLSNVHAEVELPSTVPTQTEGFSGITSLSSIASIDSMQSELPVPTHNESAIDYAKQHGEDDESKISQDDEDIYGDPSPGDTTAGGDIVPKGVKLNTPQGDDDMYGMDAVTERETNGKELSSSDKSNRDIYQVGNGAGTTKGE